MADEEVEVKIKQTSEGNAFETARQAMERLRKEAEKQFPDTAAKIKEHFGNAAKYAEKYGPDDSRAVSARADGKSLQGDLNRWAREKYELERQGRSEDRQHNRRERDEDRKHNQQKRGLRQVGAEAVRGFDGQAGIPLGGVISGLTNPWALAALAVGTVIGKFAKDAMAAHDFHAEQQQIHDLDVNRMGQIQGGTYGDNQIERSAAAASIRKKAKQELDEARAELNTAHRKGWGDMLIGAGQDLNKIPGLGAAIPLIGASGHMETSVDKAQREAKEKVARLEADMAGKEKLANEQAMKGAAGAEMARIKAKLSGNMQAAREVEYKSFMAQKEAEGHNLGLTGTFNDDFVNLSAKEKLRDEQMRIGARLVNSRSGNADVLRASQIASGQFGGAGAGRLEKLIAEQTHHINRNHEEAKQHMPRTFNLVPNLRGQL